MRLRGAALLALLALAGCAAPLGNLEEGRLRFNEVVKATSEEQMLLNVVRLRYTDTPSSLTVSSIALQTELVRSVGLIPFFGVSGGDNNIGGVGRVLPQAQLQIADRPTITLTPLDDQDFTRRLFTPISADGVLYLAKTTWPISTVFRLWLENLNWVSNAESASGPTPRQPPDYVEFQRGILALQTLQDRAQIVFSSEEREDVIGAPLPAESVGAQDVLAAAKEGYEYRASENGRRLTLIRKRRAPVIRVHPNAIDSPEMDVVARTFRLRRGVAKYDIEIEKLDPFTVPLAGAEILDLETRSLLQVLYYVSKGVEVPPEHLSAGLAVQTLERDGRPFDWSQVLRGLFRVASSGTEKPPATAHTAVRYQGCWFYIDKRDADTMATFSLLLELARLELQARPQAPLFTLPLGGR